MTEERRRRPRGAQQLAFLHRKVFEYNVVRLEGVYTYRREPSGVVRAVCSSVFR